MKLKEGQELSVKWEVTKVTLMGIAENVSSEELDQERNGSQTKCLRLLRTEMKSKEKTKQTNLKLVIENQESRPELEDGNKESSSSGEISE